MKNNENRKVTLTIGQLKKLIKESRSKKHVNEETGGIDTDYVKGQLERIRELVDGLIADVGNGEFSGIQDGVYEIEGCIEGVKSEMDNL